MHGQPEVSTRWLPEGHSRSSARRERASWLLANHSLKNDCNDYVSKVQCVARFMENECSIHPDSIWPMTTTAFVDFLADQSEKGNQLETMSSYVDAVEWFHDISGFPSFKSSPQFPLIRRLMEAAGRFNYQPSQAKEAFTPELVTSIIDDCLEHYRRGGSVSWLRAATIFACVDDAAGRINEILEASTDRVEFLPSAEVRIALPYRNSKNTHLKKPRSARQAMDYITLSGRGARLFGEWWRYRSFSLLSHSEQIPVFEGTTAGRPLSYSTIRLQLSATLTRLGVDPSKYGTHSFRKGRSTAAFQQGAPVEGIRRLLRHAPGSGATAAYLPRGALSRSNRHRPYPA